MKYQSQINACMYCLVVDLGIKILFCNVTGMCILFGMIVVLIISAWGQFCYVLDVNAHLLELV
jgi:hypothetical protein